MSTNRLSVLIAPAAIIGLLASTLVGFDRLAFRDVSFFYTPLYEYVAARAAESWLPLWNPLDQTGLPLIGETTTAFFYPIRYLLYLLPISAETAIAWYVAIHLILASWTATVAARWARCSPHTAVVAGLTYALSGPIVFLYCNPPFLVGAAWLPLALGALLANEPLRMSRRTLVVGLSLAMMILGGDPQTALHVMLVAASFALVRALGERQIAWRATVVPCLAAPLLAALLSLPQLVASSYWSWQSDRLQTAQQSFSWLPAAVGSRRAEAFQFSLAPWQLAEVVTPCAWGDFFPRSARLSQLIPGDGLIWTPSLYLGGLSLLMLSYRCLRWRRDGLDRWLLVAFVALTISLGRFGLAWCWQTATGTLKDVDPAVGGPYWLLYELLPGYDAFRYPAKWLPIFSFGIAISTALWVDQADRERWRLAGWLSAGWAVVVTLALLVVMALTWLPSLSSMLVSTDQVLPRDQFWGPLQINLGLGQVAGSLVQSLVVLVCFALVFRSFARQQLYPLASPSHQPTQPETWFRHWNWLLVVVVADLAMASSGLIARNSQAEEASLIRTQQVERSATRWLKTMGQGAWPAAWQQTSRIDRLVDVESSQRAIWFGRWHLSQRQAVFNNMTSIRSRDISGFWQAAQTVTAELDEGQRIEFWRRVRQCLGIDGVINSTARTRELTIGGQTHQLVDFSVRLDTEIEDSPVFRFQTDWNVQGTRSLSDSQWTARLHGLASDPDRVPDLFIAGLADDLEGSARAASQWPDGKQGPTLINAVDIAAEACELEIETASGGLLWRPTYQDGFWQAELQSRHDGSMRAATVHRVDSLAQGVLVPPGNWVIRFSYAPWWIVPALLLAGASWFATVVLICSASWIDCRRHPFEQQYDSSSNDNKHAQHE